MICDVIKQNGSELASIDFKIEPKIALNFLCYFVSLDITEIAISLEPNVQFLWGFQHDIALIW